MTLRINDTVPDFTADTSQGKISFHDWIGNNWAILFSHPKDFTPVCTTELSAVAQLSAEWKKRNTKMIGVSVDSAEDHRKWSSDIKKYGNAAVDYPIIADEKLAVSKLYDMLPADAYLPDSRTPADSATVRTVYIIGPDKKMKLTMTYPMNVGRNFAEILRALDGLQIAARENVSTPEHWNPGDDVIVPASMSTDDARKKYREVEEVFPYLRKAKL